MSQETIQPDLEDLNVIVSGQGGDGSLTVVNLLASVLRKNGMSVYTERDVLSRIKGGITAATLRAFSGERYTIGNHIDLLVAFDIDAVPKNLRQLNKNSIVLYDNSGGPLPDGILGDEIRAFGAPLSRQAVKTFRRDIYKNSISFGLIGRILGLPDDTMRVSFEDRFKRMGPQIMKYNLDALAVGLSLADELGYIEGQGLYRIQEIEGKPHMLITGNEAMAFGFSVAGGRFFAGYPITPSTDVMDWLIKWSPQFGGVVRQAEDELSAINMAIGSALTGTRTMVATCGPGLSLMQEGIGQLGMGEIPLVIVDAQRGGPSTGMPT
ncbi:MAG TPA: 2-oxoacid:acceptor oxidoreductase subunit alpha, partial [Gammaproteobacteria bacterium]|nr:2-oxoacid:acceptor oxidoreductase subunit alpha [Gammaproteobacteria bacterium]